MFVNLHTLPAGQHMYTVAVTMDPVGTEDLGYDEVDVVASSRGTTQDILLAGAEHLNDYVAFRVLGIVDQSDGYVLWQDEASTLLVERVQP